MELFVDVGGSTGSLSPTFCFYLYYYFCIITELLANSSHRRWSSTDQEEARAQSSSSWSQTLDLTSLGPVWDQFPL